MHDKLPRRRLTDEQWQPSWRRTVWCSRVGDPGGRPLARRSTKESLDTLLPQGCRGAAIGMVG
eukprot:scaffold182561_cov36-Tisochrysis_lutea.AAC.3